MSDRLCKNCDHYWRALFPSMSIHARDSACTRPIGARTDPVNGETTRRLFENPFVERKPGRTWFGLGRERCGPEGKYFERTYVTGPPSGAGGGSK